MSRTGWAVATITVVAAFLMLMLLGSPVTETIYTAAMMAILCVTVPAFFGIVLVQRPVLRWGRKRGLGKGGSATAVCAANIAFTWLIGIVVSAGGLVRTPRALGILAGCAIGAALIWLTFEWMFGDVDG